MTDAGRSLVNNLQDYFRPQDADKPDGFEAPPAPHADTWPGTGTWPRTDTWPGTHTWPDPAAWPHTDTWPGHGAPYGVFSGPDVEFLNGCWGTEAELTELLESAETTEKDHTRPPYGLTNRDTARDTGRDPGRDAVRESRDSAHDSARDTGRDTDRDEPPFGLTPREEPLVRPRHRKIRPAQQRRPPNRVELLSCLIGVVTALIVTVVGVLCGTVTHVPLRQLAAPEAPHRVAEWWPLLVYGPWLVASLSILRAALHHRRAPHSWCVVVLFSAFAVMLCVARAPMTPIGVAVAGLPPVATLACFHQLVRQITLTRPPRRTHAAAAGHPSPVR